MSGNRKREERMSSEEESSLDHTRKRRMRKRRMIWSNNPSSFERIMFSTQFFPFAALPHPRSPIPSTFHPSATHPFLLGSLLSLRGFFVLLSFIIMGGDDGRRNMGCVGVWMRRCFIFLFFFGFYMSKARGLSMHWYIGR